MAIKFYVTKAYDFREPEVARFSGRCMQTDRLPLRRVAQEISEQCSVTVSDVEAVHRNLLVMLEKHLLDSKIVRLGCLGSMRLSISGKSVARREDWLPSMLGRKRVIFTPGEEVKALCRRAKVQAGGHSPAVQEIIDQMKGAEAAPDVQDDDAE